MSELTKTRFVCIGRRQLKGGGLGLGIREIVGEGLGDERFYKTAKALRTGAVYDINANATSAALTSASYVGLYPDDGLRASWQGQSDAAETMAAIEKREKKEATRSEALMTVLRDLRREYQATNYRGRLAIEVTLLEALRRPLTIDEMMGRH